MDAEIYGIILRAKIVIRSNAPPENILNIPKMPFECLANISASTRESIPGSGINVPNRNTIKAKIVNNRRFFKSVALLKTEASIFAAIFSANDTIVYFLKIIT